MKKVVVYYAAKPASRSYGESNIKWFLTLQAVKKYQESCGIKFGTLEIGHVETYEGSNVHEQALNSKEKLVKIPKETNRNTSSNINPLMKKMIPSANLALIVGPGPMTRTEVVKKIWEYIKRYDLQDQRNKRNIICDSNLRGIFGEKSFISMFEITKYIGQHLHD